jgi:hypothetical protein
MTAKPHGTAGGSAIQKHHGTEAASPMKKYPAGSLSTESAPPTVRFVWRRIGDNGLELAEVYGM